MLDTISVPSRVLRSLRTRLSLVTRYLKSHYRFQQVVQLKAPALRQPWTCPLCMKI
ncbi:hypothetical protein HID58_087281 [Brassica napus]|uniref:Uncharacterized protein n=1 Tax=Brassica napus TaxID=3708 RepID=A0ABQ7XVS5_BRANA|nr:hypothetical protein HID58_087281 [Brassica napus]